LLDNPYVGYAKLSQIFAYKPNFLGVDKTSQIDPTAVLGSGVNVVLWPAVQNWVRIAP